MAGGGETERELTTCSGLMEKSPPACDAASMEVIQTGQNQTLQEHQKCRWGGGEEGKKYIYIYISTVYRRLGTSKLRQFGRRTHSDKLGTILAEETHPLRPEFDNRHVDNNDRYTGFPVVSLHDTYIHSFQRPFEHNQQAGR